MEKEQLKEAFTKVEHIEDKIEFYSDEIRKLKAEKEAILLKVREGVLRPDNQIPIPIVSSGTDLEPEQQQDDDIPF